MPVKELVAQRQINEAPLLANAFEGRAILEMEMALDKACKALPKELDTREYRRLIASKIIDRVSVGERTFGGMMAAGMAAVEELRQHREHV